MTRLLFVSVLGMMSLGLFAQETGSTLTVNGAYYFPVTQGQNSGSFFAPPGYQPVENPLSVVPEGEAEAYGGFGAPGLEGIYTYWWKYPFLNAPGVLTEGNNLQVSLAADLTPVTFHTGTEITLTPLALLKFRLGASVGTGWNVLGLNGLGVNSDGQTAPDSFSGALLKTWGAGTFQFDLGAVIPGDWTHLVTVADLKVEYQNFTGAGGSDPWYWQVDAGENFNGLRLIGTYFLGWQLPKTLPLSLVGVLTTSKSYLQDVPGTDYTEWETGPMVQVSTGDKSSLVILLQGKNKREYTPETAFRNYFLDRSYARQTFELSQLAFSWTLNL